MLEQCSESLAVSKYVQNQVTEMLHSEASAERTFPQRTHITLVIPSYPIQTTENTSLVNYTLHMNQ